MYIVPTLFSRLLYICIQAFIYFALSLRNTKDSSNAYE